ncbi:MAG TPA: SDR family oxidoreductase [Phycisphaerae bacterium]|nr:SDR family oxidoreductase [Phycisphaerae bacterium]HOJ74875.1 SDR family oxidoreductase [Phycisphaerae bacterium]HOM52038.1 SDR family oxidoreductase [Phycisphaerae bacterium]HON64916.1 SDR family oxidoreductase [Phycisphaerae bacterium]HOQ88375.1 SDR family oxidoreductase [Phycisphaerae bacterium]
MHLHDKVCIVTGAGRGIGRAIARRLTAAGARVVAAARTASDLDATVAEAGAQSGRCLGVVTDVTDSSQVNRLIERTREEFGRIDILINNAGLAPLSPMASMTDEQFRQTNAVNIDAVFFACRAAWPDLSASRGTIINIASLAAFDPFPGFTVYGAAKAWVVLFTKALAAEGRPLGIKVFAVAPGAVETQMLRAAFPDFPVGQTLPPDAVAAAVEALLDERLQHASGETICVKS